MSELPAPLKRPAASQRQFRKWARQIECDLLTPPWRILLRFYYLRKGELPDPSDPDCYACAITHAQYHRIEIRVCPDHPTIKEEPSCYGLLLHETFHSFFGALNDLLDSTLGPELLANEGFAVLRDNAEDEAVNRLAAMPILHQEPNVQTV